MIIFKNSIKTEKKNLRVDNFLFTDDTPHSISFSNSTKSTYKGTSGLLSPQMTLGNKTSHLLISSAVKKGNRGHEDILQYSEFKIAVVVPAYNEEELISNTIESIPEYVDCIYVIDDGSKDQTARVVSEFPDPRVVLIRHQKNSGVGAAIITGYKQALVDGMDVVAIMAGDNQMDPEQLPYLLAPIIEGRADYTKGNRLISPEYRKGMSKWRFAGNAILTFLTKIACGYWQITDPQNGYTAISRDALERINLDDVYPYYGYCNDLLVKLNVYNFRVMDVVMPARYGREKSKIRYSKYISKVSRMLLRNFFWRLKMKYVVLSFHPLVLFYLLGMALTPPGILLGLWIVYQKIYHLPVSPNFPLLSVFLTIMGIQFLLFAMLFDMQAEKSGYGGQLPVFAGKDSIPAFDFTVGKGRDGRNRTITGMAADN